MSPPIRDGSGSSIGSIRLGDGSEISEVRTGAGDVLFSAIPDSVVANGRASEYDGSQWVADIGPNLPDAGGNPAQKQITENSTTFDVVEYQRSNGDFSETTNISLSGDPQAVILAFKQRTPNSGNNEHALDGPSANQFTYLNSSSTNHRVISGSSDAAGGSPNSDFFVGTIEGDGSTLRFIINDNTSSPLLSDSNGFDNLTGLRLGRQGGGSGSFANVDIAEYTVLENHTDSDRNQEIDRQMKKFGLK
jgi:hypothetical protein